MNTRAVVAEFVGTFTLVLIGAGVSALGIGGLLGIAFAHGLVVVGFMYAYGHVSGAHINPAVTIALWFGQQIDTINATAYVVAQFVGGIAAALVLAFLVSGNPDAVGLGATVLGNGVDPVQGLVVEVILTFILVNVIYNTVVSGKASNFAPLAIGASYAFCILLAGPLTGASINPARTIGPAVATGDFADIWLYVVGPIVGGILAALLYDGLLKDD